MSDVLAVDDDPQICAVITRWLTGWGYRVRAVDSAAAALEAMLANPAGILLCDVRMPVHTGLWLAARVRARWPGTAIIMLTGVDDLQTVRRSRELGAVGYVTKPFNRHQLRQALDDAGAARDASLPPRT